MMQAPRHLDPSLLKQQSSPQPPSMHQHQPGLKSYLDSLMSQNAPDMQKEQASAMSSFTNFPLGGFPPHPHSRPATLAQADVALLHQQAQAAQSKAGNTNMLFAPEMAGCSPVTHASQAHSLLSPALSNGHNAPGSPLPSRSGRTFAYPENNTMSARGE